MSQKIKGKRNKIVPNVTQWSTSRASKSLFEGKTYSMVENSDEYSLPSGFQLASKSSTDEISSLISDLNDYNISSLMRTVELRFDCDGSIPASALKSEKGLRSEIKKVSKGIPGGFRRSFNGSPAEIGDVIDGTFKHAIENSELMTTASRVSKIHPVFEVEVKGSCDGMFDERPVEVKSVSDINDYTIMKTLEGNWFQFAAYNWLYGQSPLIVIVSRENLEIVVVEPTQDMVASSIEEWSQWSLEHSHDHSQHLSGNNSNNSPLVK